MKSNEEAIPVSSIWDERIKQPLYVLLGFPRLLQRKSLYFFLIQILSR